VQSRGDRGPGQLAQVLTPLELAFDPHRPMLELDRTTAAAVRNGQALLPPHAIEL
jgi:hypothetical protein